MTQTHNNYSCALGCGVFVSHAELQQHLHSEHISMTHNDDQELNEILNKEFSCNRCRYTHQLIDVEFNQAREQLLAWRDAGIVDQLQNFIFEEVGVTDLERWEYQHDGQPMPVLKERTINNRITQLKKGK